MGRWKQAEKRNMQDSSFSRQFVFTLQVIHVALAVGVVLFGAVTIFMFFVNSATSGVATRGSIKLLTQGNAIFTLSAFPTGFFLFSAVLGKGREQSKFAARVKVAYIVRTAVWEGSAFFGLVVLFLAGKSTLSSEPVYWINAIAPLLFLLFVGLTFPSQKRLARIIRSRGPA